MLLENRSRSDRVDGEHGGFSCQLDLAHRTVRFEHCCGYLLKQV